MRLNMIDKIDDEIGRRIDKKSGVRFLAHRF